MSRPAMKTLVSLLWLIAVAAVAGAQGPNPHLNTADLPRGCVSCHKGHGVPRSPMLPAPVNELCLGCHSTGVEKDLQTGRGSLSPSARPPLLGTVLSLPYTHPLTAHAKSAYGPGAITCTSCHSPHRGSSPLALQKEESGGVQRLSPRNPNRYEYELCESCHGSAGSTTQSLTDISRLFDPQSRSFHPVEAPSQDSSQSVLSGLAGRHVNCTDCHGNSDPTGPAGPHGSTVPFLLRANYTTADGAGESASTYALCYRCHLRARVLDTSPFPEHGRHIIDEDASCATCHNPHGSVDNRALIRFGEEVFVAGVSPSAKTGRLEFVSDAPGSGACYLTCHGVDHSPEAYGSMKLMLELGLDTPQTRAPTGRAAPTRRRP